MTDYAHGVQRLDEATEELSSSCSRRRPCRRLLPAPGAAAALATTLAAAALAAALATSTLAAPVTPATVAAANAAAALATAPTAATPSLAAATVSAPAVAVAPAVAAALASSPDAAPTPRRRRSPHPRRRLRRSPPAAAARPGLPPISSDGGAGITSTDSGMDRAVLGPIVAAGVVGAGSSLSCYASCAPQAPQEELHVASATREEMVTPRRMISRRPRPRPAHARAFIASLTSADRAAHGLHDIHSTASPRARPRWTSGSSLTPGGRRARPKSARVPPPARQRHPESWRPALTAHAPTTRR